MSHSYFPQQTKKQQTKHKFRHKNKHKTWPYRITRNIPISKRTKQRKYHSAPRSRPIRNKCASSAERNTKQITITHTTYLLIAASRVDETNHCREAGRRQRAPPSGRRRNQPPRRARSGVSGGAEWRNGEWWMLVGGTRRGKEGRSRIRSTLRSRNVAGRRDSIPKPRVPLTAACQRVFVRGLEGYCKEKLSFVLLTLLFISYYIYD